MPSGTAPGYRGANLGSMDSAGEHGASRSSSISQISAFYLAFRPYYFNPSNASHRAYGFQLRCLSE
ncbi:hypothetical protein [uncultured Rikenella sp.]|uniref:hypothetical protein n=1 Tax=uncultured Rikenella sp. TaxID=368003 RepID=UPI0026290BAA|nr:hypothetical protein [uncultured Rikenella sp.]